MSWQVVVRPEAADDVIETAAWYDERCVGLGAEFIEEERQTRALAGDTRFVTAITTIHEITLNNTKLSL